LNNVKIQRASKASWFFALPAIIILVGLVLAPQWAGRADLRLMGELYLYLSLACMWNLLAGYAGLVSVGQQAYVGFGGYMLFALTQAFGVHPLVAIALGGVFAALLSIPVAALIFRLHGAYFAIGTWVVAEVFRLTFAQMQSLGGGSGSSLPVSVVKSLASSRSGRESLSYWLALGAAVLTLLIAYGFLRSRRGLALMAIETNSMFMWFVLL